MKRRKYRVSKSRANPYFRTTQSRRITKSTILFFVSVAIAFGLLSLMLYAPFVRVSVGDIAGGSDNLNEEVAVHATESLSRKAWLVFPRNHRVLFSKDYLRSSLIEAFQLNDVEIELLGDKVNITVTEKVSTFYLVKDDTMFAVDRSGIVLGVVDDLDRARIEIDRREGHRVPLINDSRSSSIGEGQEVVSSDWIENIVSLFDSIQSKTMLTPETANLSDEEGRVDIETDSGVTLYFTLNSPIESQINKLESLIDRKLVNITELSYIDLRFTNRLFYH